VVLKDCAEDQVVAETFVVIVEPAPDVVLAVEPDAELTCAAVREKTLAVPEELGNPYQWPRTFRA
jgi:hypothetical protein